MIFFIVFVKILVGIFVVPMQYIIFYAWPWLERDDVEPWKRVLGGMLILPIAGILWAIVPWWEELYEF